MRRGRLIRAEPRLAREGDAPISAPTGEHEMRLERTLVDEPSASDALLHSLAEASARGRGLEREHGAIVELARLLAERLVGPALQNDEVALAHYARELIDQARGARSLTLLARPEYAARLRHALSLQDFDERDVRVLEDEALPPGTLRLETELGSVLGEPSESLARLAAAARAKLEHSD